MKTTDRCGFSILEVFIAMAILAIAMVAIIGSQTQAIKLHDITRNISVATLLARQRMAEILLEFKGKSFGELPEEKNGEFKDKQYSEYKWAMTFKEDPEFNKVAEIVDCNKSMQDSDQKSMQDFSGMICEQMKTFGLDSKAITEVLTKEVKRLTVTVTWETPIDSGDLSVWTHFFNDKMQMPGVGGG